MFQTDMGSLAHDRIHDLLEARSAIMTCIGVDHLSDQPSPVRESHPVLEDKSYDMLDAINEEIISWLQAVVYQERGAKDITYINTLFKGKLEKIDVLDEAWSRVYPKKERPIAA